MSLPADGQLPLSATPLYTVPHGKSATITNITLVNAGTTTATINLSMLQGTVSRSLSGRDVILSPGIKAQEDVPIHLAAGSAIAGSATGAAPVSVTYYIGGVEA